MICDMEIAKLEITPPPPLPAPQTGLACSVGQTGPGSGQDTRAVQHPAQHYQALKHTLVNLIFQFLSPNVLENLAVQKC